MNDEWTKLFRPSSSSPTVALPSRPIRLYQVPTLFRAVYLLLMPGRKRWPLDFEMNSTWFHSRGIKKREKGIRSGGLLVGGATDPAAAPSATPPRRFIRGNATGARTHCSVSRRSTAISSAIYQCEVPATSPPLLWLCFLFLFLFLFFCFFHFDNILLHKRERDTHKVQHASFWGEPARITSPCLRLICSWPSYPVQDNFEEDWDRCWWVQLHFVRAAVLINRTKSSSSAAGPIFPIQLQPSVG